MVAVRQVFPLLIELASVVLFISFGEGYSPRPPSEIRSQHGRQPKHIFPTIYCGVFPPENRKIKRFGTFQEEKRHCVLLEQQISQQMQHPYQPNSFIYNRINYVPPRSGQQMIGPFFGYFPNLFPAPAPVTTSTTTTTTTTTEKPVLATTCSKTGSSTARCPNCKDITSTGGTVQSPNYPSDYGGDFPYLECSYTIKVAVGKKVKITLSGGYNFDTSTNYDNLEVYNGDGAVSANRFAAIDNLPASSGSSAIILGTSSGNTITVRFIADDSQKSEGGPFNFEMKYAEVV